VFTGFYTPPGIAAQFRHFGLHRFFLPKTHMTAARKYLNNYMGFSEGPITASATWATQLSYEDTR
jgi:hypothetical protein